MVKKLVFNRFGKPIHAQPKVLINLTFRCHFVRQQDGILARDRESIEKKRNKNPRPVVTRQSFKGSVLRRCVFRQGYVTSHMCHRMKGQNNNDDGPGSRIPLPGTVCRGCGLWLMRFAFFIFSWPQKRVTHRPTGLCARRKREDSDKFSPS